MKINNFFKVSALSLFLSLGYAINASETPITQAQRNAWKQFKQTQLHNYLPVYRAATTLSAGDIAIVEINMDDPDKFAFVLLKDIDSGTEIKFTDNGWQSSDSFRANEQTLIWTAPNNIVAGTVIQLDSRNNDITTTGTFPALSTSGDQLLAYQGDDSNPNFIYAVNSKGSAVWQNNASNSNSSALPQGLTNGINAVALPEIDNYAYTGNTSGDAATLLAAISDKDNWNGDNNTAQNAPVSFTVTGGSTPTSPQAGDIKDYKPGNLLTTDNSDASTAIKIDNDYIIVGDDEASELRVYPVSGGDAVAIWSYDSYLGFNGDELDLEASAKIGSTYYFIGSHSNKANGDDELSRENLFAVTVSGTGAAATFSFINSYSDLINDLDITYSNYDFGTSTQDGVLPEDKSGFSIEGMTETAGGDLLIGFRAPQADINTRDKAIVVTLIDISNFNAGNSPTIGRIQELELGGRGIRSMYTRGQDDYLIIAGPSGSPNEHVSDDFALFTWDGIDAPVQLDNDLDSLRATTKGSFETIVDVDANGLVHLLQDNGDTVWAGKTEKSKKLPADEQKFVGNWVQLGQPIADNTAPQLINSLPTNNATTVGTQNVTITMTFDEYVKAGTGDFTLSGGASPIVIPVTDVTINGGVVKLTVPALAENTAYTVTASAGILTDTNGNDWAGITGTDYQFTTFDSLALPSHPLLITEVNSKSTGEDFFEIYNYGDTDIDMSGWKWDDESADFNDAKAQTFPAGTVVKAKKTLVVAATDNKQIFRNAWGAQLDTSQSVMAISEDPSLGKDDAVVIFNAAGQFVTGMNYSANSINYAGGTLNPARNPTGANAVAGEHAGKSFDTSAENEASAVWDGLSVTDPRYTVAVDSTNDAWTQTDGASVGSPGNVTDNVLRITKIHAIQGTEDMNAMDGQTVTIEAIVVGDFQNGDTDNNRNLGGFYVQEEDADKDTDAKTSEGIFVYEGSSNTANNVNVGDKVQVTGTVDEFYGETQLKLITTFNKVSSGNNLPTAAEITLDLDPNTVISVGNNKYVPNLEAYEGMLVTFTDKLFITDMYNLGRYGEITLSQGGRLKQFTQNNLPNSANYAEYLKKNAARTIVYDDGLTGQNKPITLDGLMNPATNKYDTGTDVRMGDTVTDLTGVLGYGFNNWRLRSKNDGDVNFDKENARPLSPNDVGGTLKVASFNVLNYFTTIDDGRNNCGPSRNQGCRGADTQDEFNRQHNKIITALTTMNADVVGLMELENTDETAIQNLVAGLSGYDYIVKGSQTTIGTDAIRVGLIYKTATVEPIGNYQVLDKNIDSNFNSDKNRPVLAQTFREKATGELFTAAVVHFKSKGSSCDSLNDPDNNDGQGNCNQTRTSAARALKNWLAMNPTGATGSGSSNYILLGDFNAYAMEDPIRALEQTPNAYTNLMSEPALARSALSATINTRSIRVMPRRFVFFGQVGTMDYAFANAVLLPKVTGVTEWHINADEARVLDYNLDYSKDPSIFDSSVPWRASDHDPILVGLQLATPYKITVNATNGTLSAQGGVDLTKVTKNTQVTFDVNPTAGYEVDKISGCDGSLSADKQTFTTGAIDADCTVSATFKAITHAVTVATTTNGTVTKQGTIDLTKVAQGTTVKFVVTPSAGYEVEKVEGCNGTLTGKVYTTGTITAACTVKATFIKSVTLPTIDPQTFTVGEPITELSVAATGGKTPLQYSATNLPAGLSIDQATGIITGTPTTAGKTDVTITVTDKNGKTATQTVSFDVQAKQVALTLSKVKDQTATLNQPITDIIMTASGGTGSYTFSATGLPDGLSIDPQTGNISGVPSKLGTFNVTVSANDGNASKSTTFTLTISDAFRPVIVTLNTTSLVFKEGTETIEPIVLSLMLDKSATSEVALSYTLTRKDTSEPVKNDFTGPTSGVVTFAKGTTTQTLSLTSIADKDIEQDEVFILTLTVTSQQNGNANAILDASISKGIALTLKNDDFKSGMLFQSSFE